MNCGREEEKTSSFILGFLKPWITTSSPKSESNIDTKSKGKIYERECEFCGQVVPARIYELHKSYQCSDSKVKCSICGGSFPRNQISAHRFRKHSKQRPLRHVLKKRGYPPRSIRKGSSNSYGDSKLRASWNGRPIHGVVTSSKTSSIVTSPCGIGIGNEELGTVGSFVSPNTSESASVAENSVVDSARAKRWVEAIGNRLYLTPKALKLLDLKLKRARIYIHKRECERKHMQKQKNSNLSNVKPKTNPPKQTSPRQPLHISSSIPDLPSPPDRKKTPEIMKNMYGEAKQPQLPASDGVSRPPMRRPLTPPSPVEKFSETSKTMEAAPRLSPIISVTRYEKENGVVSERNKDGNGIGGLFHGLHAPPATPIGPEIDHEAGDARNGHGKSLEVQGHKARQTASWGNLEAYSFAPVRSPVLNFRDDGKCSVSGNSDDGDKERNGERERNIKRLSSDLDSDTNGGASGNGFYHKSRPTANWDKFEQVRRSATSNGKLNGCLPAASFPANPPANSLVNSPANSPVNSPARSKLKDSSKEKPVVTATDLKETVKDIETSGVHEDCREATEREHHVKVDETEKVEPSRILSESTELSGDQRDSENSEYERPLIEVETDLRRTFADDKFVQTKKCRRAMRYILQTFVIYRTDIGYVQGMSYLAAQLYRVIGTRQRAFVCFANLLCTKPLFRALFAQEDILNDKVLRRISLLRQLARYNAPKIDDHFGEDADTVFQGIFITWFIKMFSTVLGPGPSLDYVWDSYLTEGEVALYKAATALFILLHGKVLGEENIGGCLKVLQSRHYISQQELSERMDKVLLDANFRDDFRAMKREESSLVQELREDDEFDNYNNDEEDLLSDDEPTNEPAR